MLTAWVAYVEDEGVPREFDVSSASFPHFSVLPLIFVNISPRDREIYRLRSFMRVRERASVNI